ncbi:hypothetical protein SK128_012240 [Halocaridina rubra]|uniref:Uncharacterized protein n=1 Tax=Halocaridina rubra TaxID=373956 RepID=A0AAN8XIW4_HALRR
MKMWCSILMVYFWTAVASGEKLGDIEVITRGELGSGGLVPPDRDPTEQPDPLTQAKVNAFGSSDDNPEHRFIPLPALSYLPPVDTPLPIESTVAPAVTSRITLLPDEYLPPRGVADEIKPVVETPNILYSAPNPQPQVPVPVVTEAPVKTQAHTTGHVYPVAVGTVTQRPLPVGAPVSNDGYYLEEEEQGGVGGLFSGIRDSKLTLLGGIVGAKSAVLQGLRNAKDSIASGVSGAIAHKAAALSSLKKGLQDTFTGGSDVVGGYDDVSEDGYGSYPSNIGGPAGVGTVGSSIPVPLPLPLGNPAGVGGATGNNIPFSAPFPIGSSAGVGAVGSSIPVPFPLPIPPIPVPIFIPETPAPSYPLYPPYPPLTRPVYRPKPNPLAGLKAKFDGLVEAKRSAVAGAIAQVNAAKDDFRRKISGIFNKGNSVFKNSYPLSQYNYANYGYPNHPTVIVSQSKPQVSDVVFHKQPQNVQSKPGYVYDFPHSPTTYTGGITDKFEAKKAAISRAISRAVAKLKAPFTHYRRGPYYRRW